MHTAFSVFLTLCYLRSVVRCPHSKYSTAMRTARPLVTCCRMAECGPSATSGVISTPRLIGPGASSRMSGFARRKRSPCMPNSRKYSWIDGNRPLPLPLELDAQHIDHVAARQDVVELVGHLDAQPADLGGTSVGGPQTITFAPSLSSPWMLLRATRLWAMSPTRPTVKPSTGLDAGGW